MPEPLLDLGDVGLVIESVRAGRGPQGVHAHARSHIRDADLFHVMPNDILEHRVRMQRLVERARGVVFQVCSGYV